MKKLCVIMLGLAMSGCLVAMDDDLFRDIDEIKIELSDVLEKNPEIDKCFSNRFTELNDKSASKSLLDGLRMLKGDIAKQLKDKQEICQALLEARTVLVRDSIHRIETEDPAQAADLERLCDEICQSSKSDAEILRELDVFAKMHKLLLPPVPQDAPEHGNNGVTKTRFSIPLRAYHAVVGAVFLACVVMIYKYFRPSADQDDDSQNENVPSVDEATQHDPSVIGVVEFLPTIQ